MDLSTLILIRGHGVNLTLSRKNFIRLFIRVFWLTLCTYVTDTLTLMNLCVENCSPDTYVEERLVKANAITILVLNSFIPSSYVEAYRHT